MNFQAMNSHIGIVSVISPDTYSIGHVIIRSSIHMPCGPLEEALFSNTGRLSVLRIVELVLGFSQEGVIKRSSIRCSSSYTLAHFILIFIIQNKLIQFKKLTA